MQALVLEEKGKLALRDIDLPLVVGPDDVKIAIHTVGVCGSDVHYYTHGAIGSYVVRSPMVLGHEAAGVVVEAGANVRHLAVGDRVCMEPGIPDPSSRAAKLGIYNVDPAVRFWATPPVHGILAPYAVHPAAFTYRLPDTVSFAEGAMVEPFAIGMQAAARARIVPGDIAAVIGAGVVALKLEVLSGRQGLGQGEGAEAGPDGQFTPAAVDKDGQVYLRRAAVVEQFVEGCTRGAAGVEDVVHDDDVGAFHVKRDLRTLRLRM